MRFLVPFFLIFFLTSCSGIVQKFHNDLDQATNSPSPDTYKKNVNLYKGKSKLARKYLHSGNIRNVRPRVKRQYGNRKKARYNSDDLRDNQTDGSLWGGDKKVNYLFSSDDSKKTGDIVLINVLDKLKDEIAMELGRAFPIIKKTPETASKTPASAAPPKKNNKKEKEANKTNNDTLIHDKISGIVIDEINDNHLLIRGKKSVLFRGQKRLVEIEGLVSRGQVKGDDSIDSTSIIESAIKVMR